MIHINARWLNKLQKNPQQKGQRNIQKFPNESFIIELHLENGKYTGEAEPL